MKTCAFLRTVTVLVVVLVLAVMTGCTTMDRRVTPVAEAGFAPERLTTWSRPVEISFEFGDEVVGTASYTVVLGIFKSGEVPTSAGGLLSASTMVLGAITGVQAEDPQIATAAAKAARSVDADGLFVTAVEVEEDTFLWLYRKRTITVRGKAMTLVDLGQVSEERADNARYLRLLPSGGIALPETMTSDSWLPVQTR